jgi:hypothetical protein
VGGRDEGNVIRNREVLRRGGRREEGGGRREEGGGRMEERREEGEGCGLWGDRGDKVDRGFPAWEGRRELSIYFREAEGRGGRREEGQGTTV